MAEKRRFSFSKIFNNKKYTACFALLMAFIFWLVITISENPTRERTFSSLPIEIDVAGTVASDLGLDLVGREDFNEKATVKVSGPSYIISSLTDSDVRVSASLSDVTKAGEYTLQLTAARNSNKSGYTVQSVSPSSITVSFDYSDTKEFKIEPQAAGASAPTGLIADTPTVSTNALSTIIIKGPRTEMEKLDKVVAFAEVNATLQATKTFDAELRLLDAEGNQLDKSKYTVPQDKIQITVPICKKSELPVSVHFADIADNFSSNFKYSLSQQTVSVIGSPDIINDMTQVDLVPISVRDISKSSSSFNVAFALPDGVRIFDNTEHITVSFDLAAYSEGKFTVSKNSITYNNLANGLRVTGATDIKNVRLCGPSREISQTSEDDIFAVADLSGKAAGSNTVEVTVYSEKSGNIWQIGTYSTTVTLE